MKQRGRWLLALMMVFALVAPTARADETPTDPAKKAEHEKERAQKQKQRMKERDDAVFGAVAKHAVLIRLRFQKDLEAEATGVEPPDRNSLSERYRTYRMSDVKPGFLIRDQRTVIASDIWYPAGAIGSVEISAPGGKPVKARLRGFLRRAQGIVFEAEADIEGVEPVQFDNDLEVDATTTLYAGSVAEGRDGFEYWFENLSGTRRRSSEGGATEFGGPSTVSNQGLSSGSDGARYIDLVTDGKGRALGFRFGARIDFDEGAWRGNQVLADEEIPFTRLRDMARKYNVDSFVHRVKVHFRTKSRHEARRDPFSMGGDDNQGEREFWGLAVSEDILLVIGRLEEDAIRKIKSVEMADTEEGAGEEAVFAGRLRGYNGFFVRLKEARVHAMDGGACPVPDSGEAMLFHRFVWRGGARRDQVDYNRVEGYGRGYGDRRYLTLERSVPPGAVLLDASGQVLGFSTQLNPEDQEKDLSRSRRRSRSRFPVMAVLFCEVGQPMTLLDTADVSVMPQEEVEAKRLPWLGVEFEGLNKGVAELLEVSASTRDGRRGLIVTRVYEGSPAQKAGIAERDILLSAQKLSGPGADAPPVNLRGSGSRFGGFGWNFGAAPAPWRARDNALVNLLKDWGEGTEYELVWLHDAAEKKVTLKVEIAPPDFNSAPRAHDEGTGLNIRDITYEVRNVLRMSKDTRGVVIARVEPGSPAAQARLSPNELILECDGKSVEGAEALEKQLAAAREAGAEQVRLVVRRLDKTRLVDLGLQGADDAGGAK